MSAEHFSGNSFPIRLCFTKTEFSARTQMILTGKTSEKEHVNCISKL